MEVEELKNEKEAMNKVMCLYFYIFFQFKLPKVLKFYSTIVLSLNRNKKETETLLTFSKKKMKS